MEDRMNLPSRGNAEMEGHAGDDFLNFKWTSLFHLEFLWSVHMEISGFEPDLVSKFPGSKLGGYLFFHLWLGHLVGSLSIFASSR